MERERMRGGWGGMDKAGDLSIAALVRNGTMSAEVAAVLWAAVDTQLSFLTVAVPQNAGKSTTSNAVLALRRAEVPLHQISGDAAQLARLQQERLGGYLVVGEFSRAPVPGYLWGEPVRSVFKTLSAGYSLQTCLHAPSVEAAIGQITRSNEVPDEQAAAIKLVVYIEMFGRTYADVTRRVAEVYELHGIENGKPIGHPLFRWHQDGDRFEKTSDPHQFGRDKDELAHRAALIGELAGSGRTSAAEVAGAVARFRGGEPGV